MEIKMFDPFNDRTSRDIRNRLSEAFVTALGLLDSSPVRQEVDSLKGLSTTEAYSDYIRDRAERYNRILDRATAGQIKDPKLLALLIWNAGLFFECHEILESLWLKSEGGRRKALQGLIQASGVFVHRELGRKSAGDKLSAKAVTLLEHYQKELSFIINLKDLVRALKNSDAEAPKLEGPEPEV